jgi:hypothetical protein
MKPDGNANELSGLDISQSAGQRQGNVGGGRRRAFWRIAATAHRSA